MNVITIDSAHSSHLLRLATYASVATALVLIAGKIAAWLMTGSVSVMASLVDSMLDAAASIVNLLAVRYSLMPPDRDHRFGHGKAEPLAGLGQAAFIAGSAVFLTLQAIERLLHPQPLRDLAVGIGVMVFAIAATLVLVMFQRHVIARTNSTAIRADALHYFTDLITNTSTIVALVLAYLGWPGMDAVFALGIAAYILYSAFQIGVEAVQLLMDHELPEDDKRQIVEIASRHPAVRGVHDLRTRRSGQTYFIQCHLEFDGAMSLQAAHAASDEVFFDLQKAFPNADVIIHEDPAGVEDPAHTQKL